MDHQEKFPFVSVVIPTYNMRDLLRDAVESLFRQSYPVDRYEIIVVDNSSTDGTGELIQSLQQVSPCPLHYYRKQNDGPGASRNLGIAKARGSIIAFTDSDCVADPGWLKNGAAKMADGVGIVQGKTLPNPSQPRITLHRTMNITWEDGLYQTCNIFYLKEILDRVGGFSPDFCGLDMLGTPRWGGEDTDLAWRVKKQGWKSFFADDSVIYHHVFPLSLFSLLFGSYYRNGIVPLPHLIRRHPELRDIVLYKKIFRTKRRALFNLFLLSLFSGLLLHWVFFLAGFPYVIRMLKQSFYRRPIQSYHRGLGLFIVLILIDIVHTVLLIFTSLIYRAIVL